MRVSIVIPAYNEELALPQTLERIGQALAHATCEAEIIVVDNDSRDKTKQVAATLGAKVVRETQHNIAHVDYAKHQAADTEGLLSEVTR